MRGVRITSVEHPFGLGVELVVKVERQQVLFPKRRKRERKRDERYGSEGCKLGRATEERARRHAFWASARRSVCAYRAGPCVVSFVVTRRSRFSVGSFAIASVVPLSSPAPRRWGSRLGGRT